MADKFRWGIMGLGNIAGSFAKGLESVPDAELFAVGSRTQDKADAFGETHNAPRRYGSYEALAGDPDVDAVYIATPHPAHHENALLCIEHGRPVLVEKPFTINAQQAREIADAARRRQVFCMEAMWTRFIPVMRYLRRRLKEGVIGEVRMISADFGFRAEYDPKSRLFDPELGGGSLLDVGVYPISLASMVLGKPVDVAGLAHFTGGVDEQCGIILRHEGGALAVLAAACRTQTQHTAHILGTEGRIEIAAPWWNVPERIDVYRPDGSNEVLQADAEGNGYNYQAIEAMRCVRAGLIESEMLPLDESISIMETMDSLRAKWGLVYPMESP